MIEVGGGGGVQGVTHYADLSIELVNLYLAQLKAIYFHEIMVFMRVT